MARRTKKKKFQGTSFLFFGVVGFVISVIALFGIFRWLRPTPQLSQPSTSSRTNSPIEQHPNSTKDRFGEIGLIWTPGNHVADVMEIVPSPRFIELTQCMQASFQKNKDWAIESAKSRAPGSEMPYDPRIGLSQDEYQEYLAMVKSIKMQKVRTATIQFEATLDGRLRLQGDQSISDLSGIEFDPKTQIFRTPNGELTDRLDADVSDGSAFGPWKGATWKQTFLDRKEMTGISESLSLGRLKESNRAVLYFDLTKVERGSVIKRSRIVLVYDP